MPAADARKHISTVSSRDAKLHHLYAHISEKGGHKLHLDMTEELTQRMRIDHVFEDFMPLHLRASEQSVLPTNFDCLRQLVDTYEQSCGKFTDYGLKYVKYLVQTCESLPEAYNFNDISSRLIEACDH